MIIKIKLEVVLGFDHKINLFDECKKFVSQNFNTKKSIRPEAIDGFVLDKRNYKVCILISYQK